MDTFLTRCPNCATTFHVTSGQLQVARGNVRCGACMHVFDATSHLIGDKEKASTSNDDDLYSFRFGDKTTAEPDDGEFSDSFRDLDKIGAGKDFFADETNDDSGRNDSDWTKALLEEDTSPEFRKTRPNILSLTQPSLQDQLKHLNLNAPGDDEPLFSDDGAVAKSSLDKRLANTRDRMKAVTNPGMRAVQEPGMMQVTNPSLQPITSPNIKTTTSPGMKPVTQPGMSFDAPLFADPDDRSQNDRLRQRKTGPVRVEPSLEITQERPEDDFSDLFLEEFADSKTPPAPKAPAPATPTPAPERETGQPSPATTNPRLQMMQAIEPEPIVLTIEGNGWQYLRRALWVVIILASLLALPAQYAWFKFEQLAVQPQWRPWLSEACNLFGCQLPDQSDASLIKSSNLVVQSHPDKAGALVVDVILTNRAPYLQNFPDLELIFTDSQGNPVSRRRFHPPEYLRGELEGARFMASRQPIHVALEILDPGSHATGYSLLVHAASQN